MYEQPSKIVAQAKIVEGETSAWLFSIAFNKFSAVSWTPSSRLQNLSVLAVQRTIILSHPFFYLNSLISFLICSRYPNLLFPAITLSALSF